ncbi:MAG: S9 family peptidase [Acidobacteria bacterium]|nr:S9 family peptidase [Acidobacteriota bacterium]
MTPLSASVAEPPQARRSPTRLETHGVVRVDDYYWLRERERSEVIDYLNAENAYTAAVMEQTDALQETLFEEIKGRIQQTDMSVPYREGDFTYYHRYEEQREYPIYCRRGVANAPEEVLLDVNDLAVGREFCQVSSREVSPDQRLLAYATDFEGRRIHVIRVKDLASGAPLDDELVGVTSNVVWANDSRTLFYTRQDPTTLRWYRIYRHRLGTPQADDRLVYEEPDDTFNCAVGKSRSKRYLLIGSHQTVSSEYRYLDADQPDGEFRLFLAREREHEYYIDHFRGQFYIRTNRDARNFKLMAVAEGGVPPDAWAEVVPHREEALLGAFELFRDHLVVHERRDGLVHLRVCPWDGDGPHDIAFDEPVYDAYLSVNREPDSTVLRFGYESLTTPTSTYDYDMVARTRTLLKQEEVLGDFDSSRYRSARLAATASDGERIPISLVWREGTPRDGTHPLLLYGYGAYGLSMDPEFNSARLSLLDRGFIFAIAHVRGGQELGRRWYDAGRLAQKRNSFTDFIAVAEHLLTEGYSQRDRLFAMGGSAGGLLMGGVANMRPDLFAGIVAQVPFVDVVTTMLDDSIPLTTGEYDEWGNPNERSAFDDILAYSPYDNVEAKDYPALLVLAGLHDSQVQYWEPAKWVAKLRAVKTDSNPLLLKTNMDAGHGGVSGRYRRYRDVALQYAFLLTQAGLATQP